MAVTFAIPGPLRAFAGGQSRVLIESSPATLAEALEALWKHSPGMRDRMVTEQGHIREHVNVFVGNENVRYTGGLQTPIPDGAEIAILPSISGGLTGSYGSEIRLRPPGIRADTRPDRRTARE